MRYVCIYILVFNGATIERYNMNQKTQRLAVIRKIIKNEVVSSQEELIERLHLEGIEITQSTLSRDLRYMNVSKTPSREHGYLYTVSEGVAQERVQSSTHLADAIFGIAFSGNIGVITTKSGYANAVSVPIDNHRFGEILGTIAGDNTILLVLREGVSKEQVLSQLQSIFPSLGSE